MFGIGSQQNDMLEEQYRVKYLKYKEKYLKLKQHGGFGKTSSGIHCFLTTETSANKLKDNIATLNLDGIIEILHDDAYVVKDGSSEVNLVQKTLLSELGAKLKFWGEKPKPVPLKNAEKVSNTIVMNRCDDNSIQEIRKAIKKANVDGGKIVINREKIGPDTYKETKDTIKSTATILSHMIVINIAAVTKDHKLIGDIKLVKPPAKAGQPDTD